MRKWASYVLDRDRLVCSKCYHDLDTFGKDIPDCNKCEFFHLQNNFDPYNSEAWRLYSILRNGVNFDKGFDFSAAQFLFQLYPQENPEVTLEKLLICFEEELKLRNRDYRKSQKVKAWPNRQ